MKYPSEIIRAREYFLKNTSHELFYVAKKLIIDPIATLSRPDAAVDNDPMISLWVWCMKKSRLVVKKLDVEPTRKLDAETIRKLDELRIKAHPELLSISPDIFNLLRTVNSFMATPAYLLKKR
jgi:hypothetical protein